ncbi:MAG: hypothetical protein J0M12_08420 [Deltaproteobacteria bacterium]|nr:hypothetical protein [Deltaproteobacteria bacterium]
MNFGKLSPKKVLSGLLIVARKPAQRQILRRITGHVPAKRSVQVDSIDEADIQIMKHEPDAIIIDVSDFKSGEFSVRLAPFVLSLPGWIRIFFVDQKPTPSRIARAAELGVGGVLKAPISHHGITTLLSELGSGDSQEKGESKDEE